MEIGHRYFGGWHQEQVISSGQVELVLEPGELPGASHCFAVDQERRRYLGIAVLAGVKVEHEIGQGAYQPGAHASEDREPGAGNLRATSQVKQPQRFTQLPMGPGRKIKRGLAAPFSQHPVGIGAAVGDSRVRKVGHLQRLEFEPLVQFPRGGIECPRLLGRGLECCQQVVCGLTRLLPAGDFLAGSVAFRLQGFRAKQGLAALAVERQQPLHQRVNGGIAAPRERGANRLRLLAQALQVYHGIVSVRGCPARGRRIRSSR